MSLLSFTKSRLICMKQLILLALFSVCQEGKGGGGANLRTAAAKVELYHIWDRMQNETCVYTANHIHMYYRYIGAYYTLRKQQIHLVCHARKMNFTYTSIYKIDSLKLIKIYSIYCKQLQASTRPHRAG